MPAFVPSCQTVPLCRSQSGARASLPAHSLLMSSTRRVRCDFQDRSIRASYNRRDSVIVLCASAVALHGAIHQHRSINRRSTHTLLPPPHVGQRKPGYKSRQRTTGGLAAAAGTAVTKVRPYVPFRNNARVRFIRHEENNLRVWGLR